MPKCNQSNGSSIKSDCKIELSCPSSTPNAKVVYTYDDPDKTKDCTWNPVTKPMNLPASGPFKFWTKTIADGNDKYADSDIVCYTFQVQKPDMSSKPDNPKQTGNMNQVVLKITMNQLKFTVNGQPSMFDVAPYLDSQANRSMIPMRFIAEAFGADVSWDDATKTQTIRLNGSVFQLTQNVPLPDGMGTPVLVKDRFFVPLRYVSQMLGASVDWDDATQTNTITYYK